MVSLTELPPIERFQSSSGAKIYRLPVEAFPGFIAYAYVVFDVGPTTIIDTGSGYGNSNDHLLQGLEAIRTQFGEPFHVSDIRRIILTHGHIDHFGGLPMLMEHTDAEIGIHMPTAVGSPALPGGHGCDSGRRAARFREPFPP